MSSVQLDDLQLRNAPPDDLVIGHVHNGMPMTPDEFDTHSAWDELYVYELVNGVLIVNPPPLEQERDPNEELGHWLRTYRDQHPQGGLLDRTLAEHTIRVGRQRRRADRVIWVGLGRRPDPKTDVPTAIIEFVSEGRRSWRRDYIAKRDEYLGIGVTEYWVFNRFQRTLTIFRVIDGAVAEQVVGAAEVYRPAWLPGFELSVGRLLSFATDWDE